MAYHSGKTHPIIIVAASTVTVAALLAIAIMVGLLPSPLSRTSERVTIETPQGATTLQAPVARVEPKAAPAPKVAAKAEADRRTAARDPAPLARERPFGSTQMAPQSGTVAGGAPAPAPAPICVSCGRVTSVRAIQQQGEAGLLGPVAGGVVGGAIGSQIGGGSGKAIATIAGAAGGAAVGTEIERRSKTTTRYVVNVRMDDGATRSFNFSSTPGFNTGDRVRVVDGRLVHS